MTWGVPIQYRHPRNALFCREQKCLACSSVTNSLNRIPHCGQGMLGSGEEEMRKVGNAKIGHLVFDVCHMHVGHFKSWEEMFRRTAIESTQKFHVLGVRRLF